VGQSQIEACVVGVGAFSRCLGELARRGGVLFRFRKQHAGSKVDRARNVGWQAAQARRGLAALPRLGATLGVRQQSRGVPHIQTAAFLEMRHRLVEMAGTEFELPQAVVHRWVIRRHLQSFGKVHARVGIAPHLQFVHRHVLHGSDKPRILFQHQPKLLDRSFMPARARKRNPQQISRPHVRWSLRQCVLENCNRFHGLPAADQLGRLIANCRRRLRGKLHRPPDQPHKRDQNAPAHAVWNNTAVRRPQDSSM
jgi:hypothetical protein